MSDTRRRAFITLLGGAAAWPLVVHAERGSASAGRYPDAGGVWPQRTDQRLRECREIVDLGNERDFPYVVELATAGLALGAFF